MLHFFPVSMKNLAATPFGAELRRLNTPHRIFGADLDLRYRNRAQLLFNIYPRLAVVALRSAVTSLLFSRPAPRAAIVETDVQALIFGIICLVFRRSTLIVFRTFIATPGSRLRRFYYRLIVSCIDIAICHSRLEVGRYAAMFPNSKTRFIFVAFGTTVTRRHELIAARAGARDGARIVTAGRSGRDYSTLGKAVAGLDCDLDIICDLPGPISDVPVGDRVNVLRDCFGDAYLERLAQATIVVVPLAFDDISSGQMVLLQAAALGLPIIVTGTETIHDYASKDEDAVMVDIGDFQAMRTAIQRLLNDPQERARLGSAAVRRFEREHTTEAFVRGLVSAIGSADTF